MEFHRFSTKILNWPSIFPKPIPASKSNHFNCSSIIDRNKVLKFFFCNPLFSLTLTHLIHSLIIFVWVMKRLLKHGWINVVSFPPSPSQKIFPDNLFKVNWVIIFVCIHCSNNCVVLLLVVKFSSSHFLFGC